MAVELLDGPLGLEALHVWTPGDGADSITLNDLSGTLPRAKVEKIGAYKSLPPSDDNRQQRTARLGSTPLPSLVRDITRTPEGFLQATNMQELRQLERAMQLSFGERDIEGTWSVLPNAAYGDDTVYWQTAARVIDLDIDEEFTFLPGAMPSAYQMHFLLSLTLSDPRWTWSEAQASAVNATQVTVSNDGNAPADPVVSVADPGTTTTIFNDTLDKQLKFVRPGGTYAALAVNFADRTALLTGGIDAVPYLDSYSSDWWDRGVAGMKPGNNTIRQTGGTGIQVGWKHTSW